MAAVFRRNRAGVFLCAALLTAPAAAQVPAPAPADQAPPRILYDVSPRAIDYQLSRLSADELSRVERSDADARYRPVYLAILTRKGMGRAFFDEALAALQTIDKATRTTVILGALPRVRAEDDETANKLIGALVAQPPATLAVDRAALQAATTDAASALVRRAGYGGLLAADRTADAVWQAASRDGHLVDLLLAAPSLGPAAPSAASLTPLVARQAVQGPDPATTAAALIALAALRPDAATFTALGTALGQAQDDQTRMAAIAGLQRIPADARPADGVQPVVSALVDLLRRTTPEKRTTVLALDATQLGTALAAALPDDVGRPLRKELRDLGVQVVRISTVPEQMRFDRQWFVVEASKPVQIVLVNPDTMSHNLVVGQPGSVRTIGSAAATLSAPAGASARAYVPSLPQVIKATPLLGWGETARLDLVAPKDPGAYVFLCTFPGHWVRMYGVMLVVPSLDDWEQTKTAPLDPVTGKPFDTPR